MRDDEIEVRKLTDNFFGREGYIATIPILGGSRKAGGLGETELEAVKNLARWLAAAATGFEEYMTDTGTSELVPP